MAERRCGERVCGVTGWGGEGGRVRTGQGRVGNRCVLARAAAAGPTTEARAAAGVVASRIIEASRAWADGALGTRSSTHWAASAHEGEPSHGVPQALSVLCDGSVLPQRTGCAWKIS